MHEYEPKPNYNWRAHLVAQRQIATFRDFVKSRGRVCHNSGVYARTEVILPPWLCGTLRSIESIAGACLATELKNNAFKLGRWTAQAGVQQSDAPNHPFVVHPMSTSAQAILAGCETIKIGYVPEAQCMARHATYISIEPDEIRSRQHPKDPWSHSLLGVQTYATSGFAEQIGLTRKQHAAQQNWRLLMRHTALHSKLEANA